MYHISSIYFEKQILYFGFAFKMGNETSPPDEDGVIIHQFWQSGGGGTTPPLACYIRNGGSTNFRLEIVARNNSTKNYFGDTTGSDPYVLAKVELEKDKYYDFKMEFQPSYHGDGIAGRFKMWMDGTVISDYPAIDIGYDPDIQLDPNGKKPDEFLHNTIGIYRYGPEPHFQCYFDNVRLSTTPF